MSQLFELSCIPSLFAVKSNLTQRFSGQVPVFRGQSSGRRSQRPRCHPKKHTAPYTQKAKLKHPPHGPGGASAGAFSIKPGRVCFLAGRCPQPAFAAQVSIFFRSLFAEDPDARYLQVFQQHGPIYQAPNTSLSLGFWTLGLRARGQEPSEPGQPEVPRRVENNHKARAAGFWTSLLDLTAAAGGGGRLLYARSGGLRLVVWCTIEGRSSQYFEKKSTSKKQPELTPICNLKPSGIGPHPPGSNPFPPRF